MLGSSSTPAAAAAAVRCILLGTTCTLANLAGWTEQGPEGGEGRVKGGGARGVFGFPEKSTMYSSYSGRTRFLQGPYLGPSGLTGWPNCKLYKIKILNKTQTQTTNTTKLDNFGSLSAKWKEQKNHHCYWLSHQMEESKYTFWNNLWGMQRSVSFFLVGADGTKSCKQLTHIWQLQQGKKRLIHWYRVIQESRLCYFSRCSPYWFLLVTHIKTNISGEHMGNFTSGYID